MAGRRGALERWPAAARLRGRGYRRRASRRRAARNGRRRQAEPVSTSRRATACCGCGASSRHRAARWTPRLISRRIRSPESRLSPERPAGAEVRAVAARLVARVLDDRVAADELLAGGRGSRRAISRCLRRSCSARCVGTIGSSGRRRELLERPLERAQTALAALLRVGLLQLQELRIPRARGRVGDRRCGGAARRSQRPRSRQRSAAPLSTRARAARAARRGEPEARFAHPRWLIDARARRPPARLAGASRRQQRARRRCGCA